MKLFSKNTMYDIKTVISMSLAVTAIVVVAGLIFGDSIRYLCSLPPHFQL